MFVRTRCLTCASPRPSSMASRLLRSSPDFSWATGGWAQSSSELRSWACSPRRVSRPCMTALVLRTISSWLSRSRASSRGYTMVDIAWLHARCREQTGREMRCGSAPSLFHFLFIGGGVGDESADCASSCPFICWLLRSTEGR